MMVRHLPWIWIFSGGVLMPMKLEVLEQVSGAREVRRSVEEVRLSVG